MYLQGFSSIAANTLILTNLPLQLIVLLPIPHQPQIRTVIRTKVTGENLF